MKKRKRRKNVGVLFLLPSLVGILIFYILPFGVTIYYSLIQNPIQKQFTGAANYAALVKNEAFLIAFQNTSIFLVLSIPLTLVAALLLALLFEKDLYGRSKLQAAILSPMVVPAVSVVLVWRAVFERNGMLSQLLEWIGFAGIDWLHSRYGMLVLVILFLWKNTGYQMILFLAGLGSIPVEIIEIAKTEGASGAQLFFKVKLRYLSPTFFFVVLMSVIQSFRIFREGYVLTGDHPSRAMYLLQHFMNNTFHTLDYQKMSAAAMVLCLFMMAVLGILYAVERWAGKDLE